MIDPVVECGNLVQLLHVFCPDDEAIPRVEIFSNCLRDISCNHGFGCSDTVLAIDDVEIAFSHFLEVLRLVVQLKHDVEHLLLPPVRHVHEVRLHILLAPLFTHSDCPSILRVHKLYHIKLRLLLRVIKDKGVLALREEFLEDDIDVVVVNHIPNARSLRMLGHRQCQAGGQFLLG